MSKFKTLFTFVIGAAIGSATTYFLLRKKYESDVETEIREVRAAYKKAQANDSNSDKDAPSEEAPETPSRNTNYERSSLDLDKHEKAQKNINKPVPTDYTTYYKPEDIEIQEAPEMQKPIEYKPPYTISPNDFGEIQSYTEMYLELHPNGVLTDSSTGEEVEDVEDLIGTNWEGGIGEYEVNTVRIRNERLSMDIEIEQLLPQAPLVEKPMIFTESDAPKGKSRKPHEVE